MLVVARTVVIVNAILVVSLQREVTVMAPAAARLGKTLEQVYKTLVVLFRHMALSLVCFIGKLPKNILVTVNINFSMYIGDFCVFWSRLVVVAQARLLAVLDAALGDTRRRRARKRSEPGRGW
jgi:hypothetical protein